jgi:hypothetical protein
MVEGATVRFTVIDGTQYLSIRDLIQHTCLKDNKQASKIWEIGVNLNMTVQGIFALMF